MSKRKNNNSQYAMILDLNAGRYYPAKITQVVLIDEHERCLIKIENDPNSLYLVKLSDIYDDMYTLLLKIQCANKD